MKDIAYFLEAAGEPEYAAEVLNAHNRLEAFADGLDKAALDCAIKAAEEAIKQRDDLLAALERCRFALEPYDDIKPRDWKSDRLNLRDAHQVAVAAIANMKGEQ